MSVQYERNTERKTSSRCHKNGNNCGMPTDETKTTYVALNKIMIKAIKTKIFMMTIAYI